MSYTQQRIALQNIPLNVHPRSENLDALFRQLDVDQDGKISLRQLKNLLADNDYGVPVQVTDQIARSADINQDGYITLDEFQRLVENCPVARSLLRKWLNNYVVSFVPKSQRRRDLVDGRYESEYSCWPPCIAMLFITVFQILVFEYDLLTAGNPLSPSAKGFTLLVYNPHRRSEIWRYMTYMFIHSGISHLVVNLLVQLLLGIPLEMVHHWWRILLIYISGVVFGSLCTSVFDPDVYLAGGSGGVYAIMSAHIATILMNWSEMEHPAWQLTIFLIIGAVDVTNVWYQKYVLRIDTKIGYAAHAAGAVAGFLVGIYVLRNLNVRPWERVIWWISFVLFLALICITIIWNIFFPQYFPNQIPFGKGL